MDQGMNDKRLYPHWMGIWIDGKSITVRRNDYYQTPARLIIRAAGIDKVDQYHVRRKSGGEEWAGNDLVPVDGNAQFKVVRN